MKKQKKEHSRADQDNENHTRDGGETRGETRGITRREAVGRLAKAAYIAPAITVMSLGTIRSVAASSHEPPCPPTGCT